MDLRVVIVGAGETGRALAARLGERHQALLVDPDPDRTDERAEPVAASREAVAALPDTGRFPVRADGTSRVVLERLFEEEARCALVATASDDDVNVEAARVARELGYDPVIALCRTAAARPRFEEARVTVIERAQVLAEHVERAVRSKGAALPVGIGLGQGELLEIRLVATSPIVGRPLHTLAPHRWRVAAVFRADALIVPTGDTTLRVDDRVLLVGDPAILPTVADYLRLGKPQFPMPFGANVITLERAGEDAALAREAETLAAACAAARLVRGTAGAATPAPGADDDPYVHAPEEPLEGTTSIALPPVADPGFAAAVGGQRAGVVVARAARRSLFERILGLRGDTAELCDRVRVPLLFARGTAPYRRILLPVGDGEATLRAADVAIDLARQLGAKLTALHVGLPHHVSGVSDDAPRDEVEPVRKLAALHDVTFDAARREGNPVRELVAAAADHDLVVVARRGARRDSYADPDVAMRVARRAPCSVLVRTVRGGR